jgi:hypothetical protein
MIADGDKKKKGKATAFHVDEQELEALRHRATERRFGEKDWELIDRYLLLLLNLSRVFQHSRVRMRKILRMLERRRKRKREKILQTIRLPKLEEVQRILLMQNLYQSPQFPGRTKSRKRRKATDAGQPATIEIWNWQAEKSFICR